MIQSFVRGIHSRYRVELLRNQIRSSYDLLLTDIVVSEITCIVKDAMSFLHHQRLEHAESVGMGIEDVMSMELSCQRNEQLRMSGEESLSWGINTYEYRHRVKVPEALLDRWEATVARTVKRYSRVKFSEDDRLRAEALLKCKPRARDETIAGSSPMQRWLTFSSELGLSLSIAETEVTTTPQILPKSTEGMVLSPEEVDCMDRYSQGRDPGSIPSLDLSIEGLSSARFLSAFKSLRTLSLNVNNLQHADDVQDLHLLEALAMKDNALKDIQGVAHLSNLRVLQIDINQIQDLSPLINLKRLSSLSASSNLISSLPPLPSSLEKLELYHNRIESLPSDFISGLKSLIHLDLGRNLIERVDGEVLSMCQLLTHLVLSQNRLTEVPILRLPFLRTLWLSGNRISNFAKWAEKECDLFLPSLEKLFIQDNTIYKVEKGAFDHLASLLELDMSFNSILNIGDAPGLQHPNLQLLYLQDNPMCSDPEMTGSVIRLFPRLMNLNGAPISRTIIPRDAASKMFESFKATGSWVPASPSHRTSDTAPHLFQSLIFEQNVHKLRIKQDKAKAALAEPSMSGTHGTHNDSSPKKLLIRQLRDLHSPASLPHLVRLSDEVENQERLRNAVAPSLEIQQPSSKNTSCEMDRDANATRIGKVFRGFMVRRRLKTALASIEYRDDDLDALMDGDDDLLAGFEQPNELDDGWLDYKADEHVVYPVRPKYLHHPENDQMGTDGRISDLNHGNRPPSSLSDQSIRSVSSAARSESLPSEDIKSKHSSSATDSAWGISDSTFLSTLRKRNRRMRQFSRANEIRAKERDPTYRFQRFTKIASQAAAAHTGPSTRDKGGKYRNHFMSVPAWAIGEAASLDLEEV